jgi:L-ascorbate metabolism protein UlaG (beta-lactamase superfamily)
MKITYLGHASLQIEAHGKTLIVDPYISANPLAKDIDIDNLEADYILITHAHGDHILDVEAIAKNTGATLISNFEIISYYVKKGFKGHSMNTGGSWQFDFGMIHMVNALHSSSFPDGSDGGNPIGFVLETEHHRVYIAGDTALTYDMKLIPEMIGNLDLAVLPVGDNFTMGYKSAERAADFLHCKKVLGYHFDTFGYIEIDHLKAVEYFALHHKELYLLPVGGNVKL